MDKLIEACIARSRTVISLFVLILLLGFGAYQSIPKEREPDVQIPLIIVTMTYDGISPEDAERLLIRPMETELKGIEGIKEMTAYATQGRASVTLEFHAGFNSDLALADVRDKVDIAKSELPEDTDEPFVKEINLSLFPVLNVILLGDAPERQLLKTARDLRDKIEQIPNVLEVDIAGDREEVVDIIIDPKVIESYQLSNEILNTASTGFNKLVASGNIDTGIGRFAVKVPGLLENLSDIQRLPLKVSGDSITSVGDVATIRKTFKDADGYARVNGQPAIVLEVSKRTGTNIIQTIDAVKTIIAEEKPHLPATIQVIFSQDKSNRIMEMLNDLENNIILAFLLVMIVILYFVGARTSFLISLSIPGAFLMGILILTFMEYTMNIVVLFSLILSIGMLVDAAIVVCEMADRKMQEGKNGREAYRIAAQYMKWPIIASTATTLVVFMPLLFWPGIVGQFMQYMPITLIAILSSSLLMAIIFIPTIGAAISRHKPTKKESFEDLETSGLENIKGAARGYLGMLRMVLRFPKTFIMAIIAVLVAVNLLYNAMGLGVEFFPDIEPDNSQVLVRARGNLSIEEKDALLKQVEQRILHLNEEIRVFYARSGGQGEGAQGELPEDAIGTILLEYAHWQQRRPASEITDEIRRLTADLQGVIIETRDEQSGPGEAKPIEIEVTSRFPELVSPVVDQIVQKLDASEGVIDIEDNRPVPGIEWEMQLDREMAARFSNNVVSVGNFIKLVTNGIVVTSYRPDDSDDEVDIRARFPESHRNLSMLDGLKVVTSAGNVPASNFVTRTAKPKISTIHRTDSQRSVRIRAGIAEGFLADTKVKEAQKWLAEVALDPRVQVQFKGDNEQQEETGEFLSQAFMLALVCMALILVTQFNRFYDMIIIMSAVFLSTVGVLLGLIITKQPFGIVMCGVGIIALSGIVVNNNIIFIDTYRKLRKNGLSAYEAIERTGVLRLRPILLTAITTVLGLIPMVLAVNIDFVTREIAFGAPSSQWWTQLSTSIAGGLTFATILTLFFTPALLLMGSKWFERGKRGKS